MLNDETMNSDLNELDESDLSVLSLLSSLKRQRDQVHALNGLDLSRLRLKRNLILCFV